jgi:hypothetical protein
MRRVREERNNYEKDNVVSFIIEGNEIRVSDMEYTLEENEVGRGLRATFICCPGSYTSYTSGN